MRGGVVEIDEDCLAESWGTGGEDEEVVAVGAEGAAAEVAGRAVDWREVDADAGRGVIDRERGVRSVGDQ